MNLREAVSEFLGLVRMGSRALEQIANNEPVSVDGVAAQFDQIKFHVMRIEEITEEMADRIDRQGSSKPS